ncbi:MAG: hypothetical protein HY510_05405 [Acidobacteria bacterium]|nr:hypothetical protein [Acidobacteriota bacterium]
MSRSAHRVALSRAAVAALLILAATPPSPGGAADTPPDGFYRMSSGGGEPSRLTWHPMPDQAIGWTGDGKILFRSRRDHPHGDYRIYSVAPEGGVANLVPLEPAAWISFEPGEKRVAFQKIGLEFHNWKRYQGGEAEQIYVGTLDPMSFKEATDWKGKDAFPM